MQRRRASGDLQAICATFAAVLLCVHTVAETVRPEQHRPAAMGNAQVGFVGEYAFWNGGATDDKRTYDAPWMAGSSEMTEYVGVGWSDVLPSKGDVKVELIEGILTNLAARGKQAILLIYIHSLHHANHSAYGKLPKFIEEDDLVLCEDLDVGRTLVPNYEHEGILRNIEDTTAALGARFNGDKRLFAFQVGYVGYFGQWLHGHESHPDRRCPLPSPTSANRIVLAAAKAFNKTFVLMPRPWMAPLFPVEQHPNVGTMDSVFLSGRGFPQQLAEIGWQDRWKTAPNVALLSDTMLKCWFISDDSKAACAERGIGRDVPTFGEAAETHHPSTMHRQLMYTNFKDDAPALRRMQDAFLETGALLHLESVTQQLSPSRYGLCVVVRNIGSAPFYAPPDMPLRAVATIKKTKYELLPQSGVPLSGVLPGTSAVFFAELPTAELQDECRGNSVCGAGQGCVDDNTAVHSRGDWYCTCPDGSRERARQALCGYPTTFTQNAETWYSTSNYTVIGTASGYEMTEASFTVSVRAYYPGCADPGCTTDTVTYFYSRDRGTLLSSTARSGKPVSDAFTLFWLNRRWQVRHFGRQFCESPMVPHNTWVHIAVVYDVATQQMRLHTTPTLDSNTSVVTCSVTPMLGEETLVIARDLGLTRPFVGGVRELRIYRDALPEAEVEKLATAAESAAPATAQLYMETEFRVGGTLNFASKHADLSGGVHTMKLPQHDTPFSNEGCLVWADTEAPPTAQPPHVDTLRDCATVTLSGFNGTARSLAGDVPADCDGDYRLSVGRGEHYVREDGLRELWPLRGSSGAVFYCSTAGAFAGSHRFESPLDALWWSRHLACGTGRTAAPPTPTPPSPGPGESWAPVPPAPRTTTPFRPPTAAPQTAEPSPATPIPATWTPLGTPAPPRGCQHVAGTRAVDVVYELLSPDAPQQEAAIRVTATWDSAASGWAAVGFGTAGSTGMASLDITAFDTTSTTGVYDCATQVGNGRPSLDAQSDSHIVSHVTDGGTTTVVFTRLLDTGNDMLLSRGADLRIAAARGPGSVQSGWFYHTSRDSAAATLRGCTATPHPDTATPDTRAPGSGVGSPTPPGRAPPGQTTSTHQQEDTDTVTLPAAVSLIVACVLLLAVASGVWWYTVRHYMLQRRLRWKKLEDSERDAADARSEVTHNLDSEPPQVLETPRPPDL